MTDIYWQNMELTTRTKCAGKIFLTVNDVNYTNGSCGIVLPYFPCVIRPHWAKSSVPRLAQGDTMLADAA